jgi:hypothetical protein
VNIKIEQRKRENLVFYRGIYIGQFRLISVTRGDAHPYFDQDTYPYPKKGEHTWVFVPVTSLYGSRDMFTRHRILGIQYLIHRAKQ